MSLELHPSMTLCGNCRFWRPDDASSVSGQCRRRSPTSMKKGELRGFWPETYVHGWCGEGRPIGDE